MQEAEAAVIRSAKAFLIPAHLYCLCLGNPNFDPSKDKEMISGVVKLLHQVAALVVKGKYNFDKKTNWVTLANKMLPAAFA